MPKRRVMVNLCKDIHATLIQAQALMTLEQGKKVSLEKVIKRLTERYIEEREKSLGG